MVQGVPCFLQEKGTHMANYFSAPTSDGDKLAKMSDAIIDIFNSSTDKLVVWCVSAALHAIEHGDFTHIPRVEKALSERGFRSNALKAWFTSDKVFGKAPLIWKLKDGETAAHYELNSQAIPMLKARYAADADAFTALLMATPYYKLTKEQEFKGFDLLDYLKRGIGQADKASQDAEKMATGKVNIDGADAVRKLVATLAAQRAEQAQSVERAPSDDTVH